MDASVELIPAAHVQRQTYSLKYRLYPILSPFAPILEEYLHQLTDNHELKNNNVTSRSENKEILT